MTEQVVSKTILELFCGISLPVKRFRIRIPQQAEMNDSLNKAGN
jgi:hypothetical protein